MTISHQRQPSHLATAGGVLLVALLGIYFVFPACLCQLLSAIGLDPHGIPDRDSRTEIRAAADAGCQLHCRCDEPDLRNAEILRNDELVPRNAPVAILEFLEPKGSQVGATNAGWSSRAPPDLSAQTTPSRAFLAVYRL